MTEIMIFITMMFVILMFLDSKTDGEKIPFISKSKKQVLVDTSILIDGRFLAVAKTGFINFDILIPRSVVGELQILADGGDDEKRTRARYGLDIISALQSEKGLNVLILADGNSAKEGVDNRLLNLAKKMNAAILTADYNLNKVAKVEGIEVLNINELVQSVRADFLPGEKLMLEITGRGNEKKQGVGHLPDGTMVVVENAESFVGTTCEVEFIRSLQTAAGKMMFARPVVVKNQKAENAKSKGRAPVLTASSSKNEAKKPAENSKKSTQKPAKNSSKNQKNSPKNQPKSPKRRRTQKSAEASLVELANRE
ncbi:MAG: PIN domain-containing protein [Candidatus Nanogingivalis sp.]